jgi:hypothetical protein
MGGVGKEDVERMGDGGDGFVVLRVGGREVGGGLGEEEREGEERGKYMIKNKAEEELKETLEKLKELEGKEDKNPESGPTEPPLLALVVVGVVLLLVLILGIISIVLLMKEKKKNKRIESVAVMEERDVKDTFSSSTSSVPLPFSSPSFINETLAMGVVGKADGEWMGVGGVV